MSTLPIYSQGDVIDGGGGVMTSRNMDGDRAMLVTNAHRFWALLSAGESAQAADAVTDESDVIVGYWAGAGGVNELLVPLLNTSSVEVRYLAAAYLARYRPAEDAWSALEAIRDGRHGLISASAALLLLNRTDDAGPMH